MDLEKLKYFAPSEAKGWKRHCSVHCIFVIIRPLPGLFLSRAPNRLRTYDTLNAKTEKVFAFRSTDVFSGEMDIFFLRAGMDIDH